MYNSNNFLLQKVAAKMALDQNKISNEEFNLLIKRLEKREEKELLEREMREKRIKEATNNLYHRYSTV